MYVATNKLTGHARNEFFPEVICTNGKKYGRQLTIIIYVKHSTCCLLTTWTYFGMVGLWVKYCTCYQEKPYKNQSYILNAH